MIVKCITIYNAHKKEYVESSWALTKGKNYVVLEINFSDNLVYYRIIPDDAGKYGHPILVRSDDFEVVSGKAPKNWILYRFNEHLSVLGPEKWSNHTYWEEDFWDDWSNCKPKALKCFEEEYKIILETDK